MAEFSIEERHQGRLVLLCRKVLVLSKALAAMDMALREEAKMARMWKIECPTRSSL
jgi:hypothetical protein